MIYADISYSKELKDLFPESEWWWVDSIIGGGWVTRKKFIANSYKDALPALTTDMLLERLPKGTWLNIFNHSDGWQVGYRRKIERVFIDKSLPNALCKLLLWLKKEGLLDDKE